MAIEVERDGDGRRAVDGGAVVGRLAVERWPDGRWFADFSDCAEGAYGPLVASVGDRDLHVRIDEMAERSPLLGVGFAVERVEDVFRIPTDPAVTGLVGVRRAWRRRGLARGLLSVAFGVLHERGRAEVVAEADRTNTASVTLLTSLGAVVVRSTVELRRPAGAAR